MVGYFDPLADENCRRGLQNAREIVAISFSFACGLHELSHTISL